MNDCVTMEIHSGGENMKAVNESNQDQSHKSSDLEVEKKLTVSGTTADCHEYLC